MTIKTSEWKFWNFSEFSLTMSVHGLIWMVDSEDRDRFKESRDELMNLLQSDSIRGQIPILLFANKQDRNMLYICPIRDPMTARSGLNFKYF